MSEGASDAEVRAWFSERYGEFVLFRPSGKGIGGQALWLTPFMLLLLGGGVIVLSRKSREQETDSRIKSIAPERFDHEDETAD